MCMTVPNHCILKLVTLVIKERVFRADHDDDVFTTGPELSVANAVEEDSGVYQCFVYNPAGNDSSAAVVRVLSELICGVWYRVYTKQDVLLHDHYTLHTSLCVCVLWTLV